MLTLTHIECAEFSRIMYVGMFHHFCFQKNSDFTREDQAFIFGFSWNHVMNISNNTLYVLLADEV